MRTVVRARIGAKIKEEAAAVLDRFGLMVSDAFHLMMVPIATEKRLPFEFLAPNEETLAAMQAVERGEFWLPSATSTDSWSISLRTVAFKRVCKREK